MSASAKPRRAAASKKPTSGPSEIVPGLFVGGWKEALTFRGARFCVLDDPPEDMPAGTHVRIYEEASDTPKVDNLDRLADQISAARARGEPVLVYCGHGIRRSPLGAAWYLHRAEGISLDAAYAKVRAARPKIEVAREWIGHPETLE